jgi:hypothetical protein
MIRKYEKGANIAAGIWLVSLIGFVVMVDVVPEGHTLWDGSRDLTALLYDAISTISILTFYLAYVLYAKAKGRSGFYGLLVFLNVIGLGILWGLEDKFEQDKVG